MKLDIRPIGIVEGTRKSASDDYWGGHESRIVLDAHFGPESLQGLEDFSHAEVLFFFDGVDASKIVSGARHPRNNRDLPAVGIFAQRGKNRPNRIGSTVCRILAREGRTLRVAELDAIDGTPVLDIKPVMREFLPRTEVEQPAWCSELMQVYWDSQETK
jgi:tRNA-Thr(GGU) m(6)t(6)A37 methyltransferase TsaA